MPDTEIPQPVNTVQQLRRALAAVTDMRAKLAAAENRTHEPVAIVGMACRFPGGPDLEGYWRMLVEGRDAVTEVPSSRWDAEALYDPDPDAPGKASSRWGGFIDGVDRFDAAFFGISPREALLLDPQQRLLLEVSWHALEDAAMAPDRLSGSATGVYVGLSTTDYARVLATQEGAEWIDAHASLGNSVAVAAGRLSYSLGLQGPAMVVDTACSSSLVAVHLAVQALRGGEVSRAIAAGVNLMLSPELTIGFSKARMMAADGRCKTLDAAADGYVRGEGCGVVVLKRLSDALSDGDRIHALVLGSAVNQDGRSNGLTAPNGPAQAAVIRAALANARVTPEQVSYIEAHGTGTPLGDPIEVRALAGVFGGRGEGGQPALLGSVKTNTGHLEAAAGMAGLIKAALAAERGMVPAHLHFRTLNPHIAADGFPFEVPTRTRPWTPAGGRRIAGVSSFGFSGTNAHVVVAGPPEQPPARAMAGRPVHILPLSARDAVVLDELRAELARRLSGPDADVADLAATLGAGRAHHPHRMAVVGTNVDELRSALTDAAPVKALESPSIAMLFTGQGCQYAGMARGLMAEPRFRDTIRRCDEVLGDRLGLSLSRLLLEGDRPLTRTDLLQPVLFAIEVAVADLWRSWGIEASAVLGHSVGEIAAACHAGAFPVEDGLLFIAVRGRLMESRAGLGGMATVFAGPDEVAAVIAGTGAVIAGLNAPASTVIAGTTADLATALEKLAAARLATHPLEVATGFHSPVLDPCLDGIESAAARMQSRPARLPVASNLTGELVRSFDAAYWRAQARRPVRFADGLRAVREKGCTVFLEVGPQPVLSTLGRSIMPDAAFVASLRRGTDDHRTMANALASLYKHGASVDWPAYHRAPDGGRGWSPVAAPSYPFRHDRFWPDFAVRKPPAAIPPPASAHPLPGWLVDTPLDSRLYESRISVGTMPFLADHEVFGEVVVPGAMHAVLGLLLAKLAGNARPAVADLVFARPLTVPPEGVTMHCVAAPAGGFSVHGRSDGDAGWIMHAEGRTAAAGDPPPPLDLDASRARLVEDGQGPAALFDMLAGRGIRLGPAFRGLHRIWRGEGEALAEIRRPGALSGTGDMPIHPALLDSCFQLLGATFTGEGTSGGFLPLSIDRVGVWHRPGERFFCFATIAESGPSTDVAVGHFTLADEFGRVLIAVEGLQIKRVASPLPADPIADAFLDVEWVPADLPEAASADWALPAALETAASAARPDLPETGLGDALEALASACAADALMELGTAAPPALSPAKRRLFDRLREIADGSGGGRERADRLRAAYPENTREIDLVARCGAGIAGVLRGAVDPLDLLFPKGAADQDSVYAGGGLARSANDMAAAAFREALSRRAGATPPRVLEIGAGTGATTAALLPLLPDGGSYLFTDISPAFLAAAERTFGAAPGFAAAAFDLEAMPAGQGVEPGSFDIVIAANVVHATADIRRSVGHIRSLLAPGGLLILVESTAPQRWWDIVFGLTDGWWRFSDTDLRPDHALLNTALWKAVLGDCGFADTVAVPVDSVGRQSVILARPDFATEILLVYGRDGGEGKDIAEAVADRLAERGRKARAVAVDAALAHSATGGVGGHEMVFLGAVGAGDQRPLRDAFDLTHAMLAGGRSGFRLVTRGAQSAGGPVMQPETASLWGFGKVAALEHPELDCRRIDLDPDPSRDPVEDLAAELLDDGPAGEGEVAWRGCARLAARLVRCPLPSAGDGPELDGSATYLVVGAFGGLGLPLARWLIGRGACTLVLAGRRLPNPELSASLEALSENGITIHRRVVDVADAGSMTALFREIENGMPPLKGVFHLAGHVSDGALITRTWDEFASVLPAKIDGAGLLHRLTAGYALDHFVLFSTSAALIGNRGQANHAAANAYLDALAEARRSAGLPGLSIDWGAWGETGAVVAGDYADAMAARGVRPIATADGLEALGRAMADGARARLGFVDVDWPVFLAGYGGTVPPFLKRMAPSRSAHPTGGGKSRSGPARDFRALLAAAEPGKRRALLADLLRAEAAEVLGLDDPGRIDDGQALNEIGLDSLLALELRNRLGAVLDAQQPATLLFNYPSIAALTAHLAEAFGDLMTSSPEAAESDAAAAERILVEEVMAMTDEDIEAFLDQELAALEGCP